MKVEVKLYPLKGEKGYKEIPSSDLVCGMTYI